MGFDWPDISGVWEKVEEEIQEIRSASDAESLFAEVGDLLFAVVNLSRWLDVDGESALRQTNKRFSKRFNHIESAARRQGRSLADMTLQEMDAFWDEAKTLEWEGWTSQ